MGSTPPLYKQALPLETITNGDFAREPSKVGQKGVGQHNTPIYRKLKAIPLQELHDKSPQSRQHTPDAPFYQETVGWLRGFL